MARSRRGSARFQRAARCVRSPLSDSLRRIQRAPEIPSRDRAVRPPFLTELHELFRRGKFSFAKSLGETFANSVIVHRPYIGPAEIEQEKHLDCPSANAAHGGETRNDLVIAHSDECAPRRHRGI